MKKLILVQGLFVLASAASLLAEPLLCPSGSLPNNFGSPQLGPTADICGNVTPSASVVIDSTTGTYGEDVLRAFLGVAALISDGGLVANDGSALRFVGFFASAGATITVDWSWFVEPQAVAFAFATLDGALYTLEEYDGSGGALGVSSPLAQSYFTVPSAGSHTLGLGLVNAGVFINPEATFDPQLTVTNITLEDTVPEPGTLTLLALGVGALQLVRRRA